MIQYLYIINNKIPNIKKEDLKISIENLNIDSLDLIVIRVSLEKYFGIELQDNIWYNFKTLNDALKYFHKNKTISAVDPNKIQNISISSSVEIGMPQMANSALSENWLLKFIGNEHWKLLSKGFNKKTSEFTDDLGNRRYASFIRINYSLSPLKNFKENDIITFNSDIFGFGNETFLSKINGLSSNNFINSNLMTVFSIRAKDNNTKLIKSHSKNENIQIKQLSKMPNFINDYRIMRNGSIDKVSTNSGDFIITDDVIFSCIYKINPFYDINGVGLLYYASYPIISDMCFQNYNDHYTYYQTTFRDIFYFANANRDEEIIFHLNAFEEVGKDFKITTSLFRKSDKSLIAKILTVKSKA